jgi:PDZ domain-containing secreted protein
VKVKFVGESPARTLLVEGQTVLAVNGVPIDVPEDVARSLLEQDVWEAVKATKKEQADA